MEPIEDCEVALTTTVNDTARTTAGVAPYEDLERATCDDLRETEAMKADGLRQLRELLAEEPLLDCPTDEEFLIKFLRARKYAVDRAFKNVTQYFRVRQDWPELFDGLSPCTIPFDVACREHHLVTVSRQRDPNGRTVVMLKLGAWNSSICSLNDFFRVGLVHVEHLLLQEETQLKGFVLVMDFDGLGAKHLTVYTPSVVKRLFHLFQDFYPVRIKAFYVINNPAIVHILFAIAKLFMKAKLLERTHFFGYDLNKIKGLVPDELIPADYGGTLEIYDYDKMENDLKKEGGFFMDMTHYGYCNVDAEAVHTRL